MKAVETQSILCVDDDKKNLELLEALLLPLGYDLEFSGSGEDALNRIAQRIPDLILLDIMMPVISGLEVLTQLRSSERTRSIPVILALEIAFSSFSNEPRLPSVRRKYPSWFSGTTILPDSAGTAFA